MSAPWPPPAGRARPLRSRTLDVVVVVLAVLAFLAAGFLLLMAVVLPMGAASCETDGCERRLNLIALCTAAGSVAGMAATTAGVVLRLGGFARWWGLVCLAGGLVLPIGAFLGSSLSLPTAP
ncbi:hypothetical protein G5V59_01960 [Nocardioides sp. W3-2-3]|uniref:hypothetical protein n=1 Tax=Nocardioides convexus TaxID=2712224 RepID=UPI0024185D19|nr:hypothetical protein [Nocardioides convexus]NGZ99564.1 hypothetical protein [Nocardioides convexus]